MLQELLRALFEARLLLARQGFRGEVVDAVGKAPLDEVAVHAHVLLLLLRLDELLKDLRLLLVEILHALSSLTLPFGSVITVNYCSKERTRTEVGT